METDDSKRNHIRRRVEECLPVNLPEAQLAEIGLSVVARLAAFEPKKP